MELQCPGLTEGLSKEPLVLGGVARHRRRTTSTWSRDMSVKFTEFGSDKNLIYMGALFKFLFFVEFRPKIDVEIAISNRRLRRRTPSASDHFMVGRLRR